MLNILVVEDDKNTRKLITTVLKNYGYDTIEATNGAEALDVLDHNHVDLMVLDVMMPQMDGYELAETLRESGSQMPMLMLSARSKTEDIKQGFVVGIDDYMTKPFDFEELLLRIKALLRRSKIVAENKLVVGKITLDYNSYSVINGDVTETLPQKEFLLLYKLLSYPKKTFSRAQLMDEFWGVESDTSLRAVDVYVTKLRDKLSACDGFQIVTVRGAGVQGGAAMKIKENLFPLSLFAIYLGVLFLMSGIHTGLIVFMNKARWGNLAQTVVPMIYWGIAAAGLTLFTRQSLPVCRGISRHASRRFRRWKKEKLLRQ